MVQVLSVAGFSAYFCQSGSLGKKMPDPSKRSPQRQANSPMGWAWNTSEPLRIASQWGKVSWTNKENDMKKTLVIAAAAMLIGSSGLSFAGSATKGASGSAPGTQMNNSTSTSSRGASELSPGDKMRDSSTPGMSNGASEFTPGENMNDARKK